MTTGGTQITDVLWNGVLIWNNPKGNKTAIIDLSAAPIVVGPGGTGTLRLLSDAADVRGDSISLELQFAEGTCNYSENPIQ